MGDHRYPLHVCIIGIMCKDSSKLYMASVMWSDRTDVIVYRSLRDFKLLHRQLKKKFPVESPFRPQDRVLPRFRGLKMKLNLQRKTPAQCMSPVKDLECYCNKLLSCDPRVSQSSDLIHFFIPKEDELHPEFANNSIMIFQPEDSPNGRPTVDLSSKRLSDGNVSQPLVTKLYRCLAPYETKDTKNRPFSVTVDETLEVLIKDKAGWWLVENEEKHLAWFPAPYLELCEDEEEDELDNACGQTLYCATRNYTSSVKDELSVNIGAVVEVIQKSDDGWWLTRYNGKAGYVPSVYLKPYTNPMFSIQKKLHRSNLNLSRLLTALPHNTFKSQLHKSHSMELFSEPPGHSECCDIYESSFSDDTDFCSSSSVSLSLSLYSSKEEENPTQSDKDAEPDSPDSVLSTELQSPTNSESSCPSKLYPQVPPRPQTQEILTRCTTYTRKAALKTQARLFDRTEIQAL